MSARALRRLQGRGLDELRLGEEESEPEQEDDRVRRVNPFALLKGDESDKEEEEEKEEPEEKEKVETVVRAKAKKKKSKKKKAKPREDIEENVDGHENAIDDDFGSAMADLSVSPLAIDTKALDYERELRLIFGKEALVTSADQSSVPVALRAQTNNIRTWGGKDGRTVPGQSRKLVLTRIKPFWPPSLRRDMTMSQLPGKGSRFRIVHAEHYKEAERLYRVLITTGDHELLMHEVLTKCPYHVNTLILVADNMTMGGQHSEAADMLERGLLVFDRALGSASAYSFSGRCHLPFKYYENRALYLILFKYIRSLMRRNTWRTVVEYTKLLWSLDPSDPYGCRLMIDFFAYSAGQLELIVELANDPELAKDSPNLLYSRALAYHTLHKDDKVTAEQYLIEAIRRYPWVASALLSGIELDYTMQPNSTQEVYAELYVAQMRGFWDSSDMKRMLVSLATRITAEPDVSSSEPCEPSRDLCRYVLLSEQTALYRYIPERLMEEVKWADDVLPPEDNESSYD